MARLPSVAELLRKERSEDELRSLAEQYRAEIARIQRDLDTVEAALEPRRRVNSRSAFHAPNGAQQSGVKRDDVLQLVGQQGHPVTAPEIRQLLESKGFSIRTEAVRTHFMRLVKEGRLVALGDGRYAVARPSDGSELGIEAPDPPGTLDSE